MLFGLTGCNSQANAAENNRGINLYKLEFTYPKGWTKRGNEKEIFFDDEDKQINGQQNNMAMWLNII